MRIVYTLTTIKDNGGVQRIVLDKCNYLVAHGYEIHIVYFGTKEDKPEFYVDPAVHFHAIDEPAMAGSMASKLQCLIHSVGKYKRLIREIKPDIVDNANSVILSWIIPFVTPSNVKCITELHQSYDGVLIFNKDNYGENSLRSRFLMFLRRYIYPKYDKMVVLTKEDQRKWKLNNCITIPNFTNIKAEKEIDYNTKNVIWVGRLTHQKGVDLLIQLLDNVLAKSTGWKFTIIGDGKEDYKNGVLSFIDKHQEQINYVSGTNKIATYYSQASIYLSTSRFEGLPLSLIEAATVGLPIVGFQITGNDQIVTDGNNGYLCQPFDVQELSDKLLSMMNNVKLRQKMGLSGKQSAHSFNKDIVMGQWINLFKSITNTK